jgi:hypothetical protein
VNFLGLQPEALSLCARIIMNNCKTTYPTRPVTRGDGRQYPMTIDSAFLAFMAAGLSCPNTATVNAFTPRSGRPLAVGGAYEPRMRLSSRSMLPELWCRHEVCKANHRCIGRATDI